jgi:hypothetical protein
VHRRKAAVVGGRASARVRDRCCRRRAEAGIGGRERCRRGPVGEEEQNRRWAVGGREMGFGSRRAAEEGIAVGCSEVGWVGHHRRNSLYWP